MADTVVRKHIIFYGRVQDVGFRYFSVYKARLLGLAGWVKNLDDGSVEMEVQGKEAENVENIAVIPDHDFVER